ncbi:MAG: hypothetical protein JSV84_04785 [Gemmatimonadota bacterium]|nr:MAG: hypothetical protein JSV84_04785 [Gemmatimonadota bacterium]
MFTRHKRILLLCGVLLLVGGFIQIVWNSVSTPGVHSSPFACTSFAVYAERTLYGMNFDYSDVAVRFTIRSKGDLKVFQMEFQQEDIFLPTVGMNSEGFFASLQMLFPEMEYTESSGEDEVYTGQLFGESLFRFNTVGEVNEFIRDKRVIHWYMTLHSLFADTLGDAMIVEPGDRENDITRIENNFIVMTNFPVGQFRGRSYTEVEGSGAKRYKTAYQHILDHFETFDLNRALETLEKSVLTTENFSTQCSMVFDPEGGEVFIALKRDFKRIWKVSLGGGTIKTYSGFDEVRKLPLDSLGVLASEIVE